MFDIDKVRVHELNELPPKVQDRRLVGIDTEFFGMDLERLHYAEGTFASVQIAIDEDVYIITEEKLIEPAIRNVEAGTWVMQKAQFDIFHLRRFIHIEPRPATHLWDILLVEKLLWNGLYESFSLSAMCRRYLDYYMEKDVRDDFSEATELTEKMVFYGAVDAYATLEVAKEQIKIISAGQHPACEGFWFLYSQVEQPMIEVLLNRKGVLIDQKRWLEVAEMAEQKKIEHEQVLQFNYRSHVQVKDYFRDNFSIDLPSTGKAIMRPHRLQTKNPDVARVAGLVMDGRSWSVLANTYGEKWLRWVDKDTGRIIPDDHIIGANTGRGASTKPNMQNVPVRTTNVYRECIIADEGNVIIVADWSQQEPMITGKLSNDENYLRMIFAGEDIHLMVTREMFENPDIQKDDIDPLTDIKYRSIGKGVNLGLVYGLSAQGLSEATGLEVEKCEVFINKFFSKFPGIQRWITKQQEFASKNEYVLTHRKRVVWVNLHGNQWTRNAINAPVQGTAAAMMKRALINLLEKTQRENIEFPFTLWVHDEIVCETKFEYKDKVSQMILKAMDDAAKLICPDIPFRVDMEIGKTWAAKQVEENIGEIEESED